MESSAAKLSVLCSSFPLNNQINVQAPSNYHQVTPPANQNQYNPSHLNIEKTPPRKLTPYPALLKINKSWLSKTYSIKTYHSQFLIFQADQICDYHLGAAEHNTKNCINLKYKIQDLIDQKIITLPSPIPNVTNNTLPKHEGASVNLIKI